MKEKDIIERYLGVRAAGNGNWRDEYKHRVKQMKSMASPAHWIGMKLIYYTHHVTNLLSVIHCIPQHLRIKSVINCKALS